MYKIIFLIFILFLLNGCQKPETKVTYTMNASFTFTGIETWPQEYIIALGAFNQSESSPLAYVVLDKPDENTLVTLSLQAPVNTSEIRLYLGNTALQPISSFYATRIDELNSSINLPEQAISMVSYTRVQEQVLNSCTACHGGSSGEPAAGLNLTTDYSWEHLVNQPATNSGKNRVTPGDTAQSFLWDVMHQQNLPFIHSASSSIDSDDFALIKSWIENGALEK